jgi:chromosome segregation ATPase
VKHAWKKHCKSEVEEQCQKLKDKHAKEKNELDEKLKEAKSHLATSEENSKLQSKLIEKMDSENKKIKAEYEELKSQMDSAIKLLCENKQYRNDSADAIYEIQTMADESQTMANFLYNKLAS